MNNVRQKYLNKSAQKAIEHHEKDCTMYVHTYITKHTKHTHTHTRVLQTQRGKKESIQKKSATKTMII